MVADLTDAAELGHDSFLVFLRHRLVFANSEHIGPEDRYYDSLSAPEDDPIGDNEGLKRAGLGVYLFCHHAERWGSERDAESRDRANTLLCDPHVRALLFDLYEVDEEFRQDQLALHEAGTTSFILKMCSNTFAYALKIIKPWYFDDDVISQQTQDYKNAYGYLAFVIPGHFATIQASNRYCIVMDFIEAITLRELFLAAEFRAVDRQNADPTGNSLVSVMTDLLAILSRCSSNLRPTVHGDLSTTNILVQPPAMKMFLIDFGTNYLLTRPVGTADQRSKASYLISKGHDEHVANGDVYRVGTILAEGLLGQDFSNESVPAIVDEIYGRYPSMGAFMDRLFTHATRSQTRAVDGGTITYQRLSDDLEGEFAALADAEAKRDQRKLGVVDDLSLLVSPVNLTQTYGYFKDVFDKLTRGDSRKTGTGIQLRNLTWIPLLINLFVFGAFIITVSRHLDDSLWPAVIGWTTSLTYSVIAARYCVFVFRDLNLSDWPGWPKVSVPITCVLIWPPILMPLLVDWSWWAICVAFGTAIIAVNNEVCVRSCKTMHRVIDASDRDVSRLMARALDYLIDWRQLMGIFSFGVFILTGLIWANLVHDVLFYGVIVAVAPAVKMYLQQTGKEAPIVHAGLHRTVNTYRQAIASGKASAPNEGIFHTTTSPERVLKQVDSGLGE